MFLLYKLTSNINVILICFVVAYLNVSVWLTGEIRYPFTQPDLLFQQDERRFEWAVLAAGPGFHLMVDSEHRVCSVPHRQRVDSVHPGTQESLRPTAGWRNVPVQVL